MILTNFNVKFDSSTSELRTFPVSNNYCIFFLWLEFLISIEKMLFLSNQINKENQGLGLSQLNRLNQYASHNFVRQNQNQYNDHQKNDHQSNHDQSNHDQSIHHQSNHHQSNHHQSNHHQSNHHQSINNQSNHHQLNHHQENNFISKDDQKKYKNLDLCAKVLLGIATVVLIAGIVFLILGGTTKIEVYGYIVGGVCVLMSIILYSIMGLIFCKSQDVILKKPNEIKPAQNNNIQC